MSPRRLTRLLTISMTTALVTAFGVTILFNNLGMHPLMAMGLGFIAALVTGMTIPRLVGGEGSHRRT